jgi:16S rRNA (guanine527-N7)-methyltransferase
MPGQRIEGLQAAAADAGIEVSPGALERLAAFLNVFAIWSRRTRLTGERDLATVVSRHVADSLAVLRVLPPGGLVADVGSGAGFPGIVLACMRPEQDFALIESRRRRVSFLREVARSVPLPRVSVLEMRAEDAGTSTALRARAQAVIARGLRVDVFLSLAQPLMGPGGVAIAMQAPAALATAVATASAMELRLVEVADYRLRDGAPRSLLVFGRAKNLETPVS